MANIGVILLTEILCLVIAEKTCDIFRDVVRVEIARITCHRLALLVEKEFLEIPGDVVSGDGTPRHNACAVEAATRQDERVAVVASISLGIDIFGVTGNRECFSQKGKERVGFGTVDVHFAEQIRKAFEILAGPDVFKRVGDIAIILIGLMAELVAEDAQYVQGRSKFLLQGVHRLKILNGCSSECCAIENQRGTSNVLGHLDLLSIKTLERESFERCHGAFANHWHLPLDFLCRGAQHSFN